MGPFFSRQSVLKLEWLIHESIEKLCGHLQAAKATKEPMDMSLLYRSLTSDIISEYAFSQSYGFLDNLENSKNFFGTFNNIWKLLFVIREVPVVSQVLRSLDKLPGWMVPKGEAMTVVEQFDAVSPYPTLPLPSPSTNSPSNHNPISLTMSSDPVQKPHSTSHPTIFTSIQLSKLPARDKTEQSLFDNAGLFITAGFETTGFALSLATFHLLANPSICAKLKAELATTFPPLPTSTSSTEANETLIPPWTTLEKLPYLHAVIQESLRMSVGVMGRLQRINKKEDMRFGKWVIPRGTIVGMSQPMIHFNETIFPDPWRFEPERWLKERDGKALERYLVSFSRGARECVGMQ
jgi:hypothetical protein